MEAKLINLFYKYLEGWSWEEWQTAGSSDREEVAVNAIADLGPEVDIEEAYDIFYDWAAGLTGADFGETITEASRSVASRYGSTGWYSGYASGLNDISNRVDDKERAQIAAAAEERRQKQAAQRAAYRAAKKEREAQRYLTKAQEAIAAGTIEEYNYEFAYDIRTRDYCPAIDPVTKELVYDSKQKEEILKPVDAKKEEEEAAKKAAAREAEAARAARREAEKTITYYLYAEVVINGETMRDPNGTRVVGQENLASAAKTVATKELNWINAERKFYIAEGHPFNWDGVITIICKNPDGTEGPFRTFKVRAN